MLAGCVVLKYQTMEIKHIKADSKGHFQALEEGKVAGKMTYSKAGEEKMIIDHTEVDPAFRGKNIGKLMVIEAVEFARNSNLKVIPLCPFAKRIFDKTPEINDVLN